MASYWRELRDCESDKELVRAGLAYFTVHLLDDDTPDPEYVCQASDWTPSDVWYGALERRRLWVLVEDDDGE